MNEKQVKSRVESFDARTKREEQRQERVTVAIERVATAAALAATAYAHNAEHQRKRVDELADKLEPILDAAAAHLRRELGL